MLIAIVPILVVLAGAVLFFASKNNADWKEVGRIMFFCGLLVLMFVLSKETVRIG